MVISKVFRTSASRNTCANYDLFILEVFISFNINHDHYSCCVDSVAAMHVQGNAVIHYGHTCFSKTNIPVFTVLPKKLLQVEENMKTLQEHFSSDENVKLCLFYDAEFEHCIGKDSQTSFF